MRARELLICWEMNVREDALPLPPVRPLRANGVLHLHDHLAVLPDRRGIGRDRRADLQVVLVAETTAQACAGFNAHGVAGGDERLRASRHERDAILVGLYFLRNADLHGGGNY